MASTSMHPAYRRGSGLSEWAEEVFSRRVYAVLYDPIREQGQTDEEIATWFLPPDR